MASNFEELCSRIEWPHMWLNIQFVNGTWDGKVQGPTGSLIAFGNTEGSLDELCGVLLHKLDNRAGQVPGQTSMREAGA